MGRKRRNNVYRHYMLHEESQTSTCLLCYKTLNSTHGSNLMNHLKFMHKIEYQQILALNNGSKLPVTTPSRVSVISNDDDSNLSEPDLEVDVEKFFSTEQGTSRARCDICQVSVDVKGSSLMSHLKREHPKILKSCNEESDADDQDDLYQEVVYLYDSDSKSPKNARPVKFQTSGSSGTQKQAMKHKMKQFNRPSGNFEMRKRQRMQETLTSPPVDEFVEELENFGKYVTCLLKTIPNDVCAQLQMEIINLIMTAKIRNMSKSDVSTPTVLEKLDNVSAGTYNQSIVVTLDGSKLENSGQRSPESNMGEMTKTESN